MITFEQAKQLAKAEAEKRAKPPNNELVSASDVGDAYLFYYGNPAIEEEPEGAEGILVSKDNGSLSDFFLPDRENFARLKKAKELPL